MGGKDGGGIGVVFPVGGYRHAGLPLVKMSYRSFVELSSDILCVLGVGVVSQRDRGWDSLPPGTTRRCSQR